MDNPWLEIRNSAGHLLFRYNPYTNEIEFRKNGYTYDLVRLDEIRQHLGIIELPEKPPSGIIGLVERKNGNAG